MIRHSYSVGFIRPQDYETMRSLVGGDVPNTYDEWLKLHTNEKIERGRVGFNVRVIEINPDEFVRFCRAHGMATNGAYLMRFIEEKAGGTSY